MNENVNVLWWISNKDEWNLMTKRHCRLEKNVAHWFIEYLFPSVLRAYIISLQKYRNKTTTTNRTKRKVRNYHFHSYSVKTFSIGLHCHVLAKKLEQTLKRDIFWNGFCCFSTTNNKYDKRVLNQISKNWSDRWSNKVLVQQVINSDFYSAGQKLVFSLCSF